MNERQQHEMFQRVDRHGCFLLVAFVLIILTCCKVDNLSSRIEKLEATSGQKETK